MRRQIGKSVIIYKLASEVLLVLLDRPKVQSPTWWDFLLLFLHRLPLTQDWKSESFIHLESKSYSTGKSSRWSQLQTCRQR